MNGTLLKSVIIAKGKTIKWLAAGLNCSTSNLYSKIQGNTSVSVEEAQKIVALLELSDEEAKNIFFGQ